jgi:leucyl aminopeptidase
MFDSGGISLKRPTGMEGMKGDMAGGAAVAATMFALARLGVKKNVLGVIPAVVNSPGGKAQNPGDIVKSFDGPAVEIISTDAEGRLILADGLSYARELGASYLIDIATLTGASVVALGKRVAGIFPVDEKMKQLLMDNVNETGERLWPMPMFDIYKEQLKSTAGEIKNVGNSGAGAITAAKFLEYFTDKKPWVHIDIASKEIIDRRYGCYRKGATGFGVRTLLRFVETWET